MVTTEALAIDPTLDLVLDRVIDVPRRKVWAAWTQPEHLMPWFCPAPYSVPDCEIDLRPGGIFRTTMRGPDGHEFQSTGIFLEIVPEERLIWTDALLPGYRPAEKPFMTGVLTLETVGAGTRYHAMARHRDVEARAQHEEMGFTTGWGKALDQLIEYAKTMP